MAIFDIQGLKIHIAEVKGIGAIWRMSKKAKRKI